MSDSRNEFIELFAGLAPEQQSDILALMKTLSSQPKPADLGIPSDRTIAISQIPTLNKEWHCLNALKEVVHKHYTPHVELAYVAFHPNLDSVSTAKSRAAVQQMYLLEAAYELKNIFESNPESDVLDPAVIQTLQEFLYREKP